ncbi:hypothetical protein [Eilatimonas milleporae]|uniref:Lambda family phage tail tape measure protein n=1 Tax=Eilatimonas milleporae TaxID=911205 RepID=A0A3M0CQX6_9PROT|nr:hypothetical protein [Eilatimonas milleporae]RMB11902.1 hypothetical protein BXY39_0389 [Eilatimonas milleporae]
MTTITLSGPNTRALQQQANQIVKINNTTAKKASKNWRDELKKLSDGFLKETEKRTGALSDGIADFRLEVRETDGEFSFNIGEQLDSLRDLGQEQLQGLVDDSLAFGRELGVEIFNVVVDKVEEVFKPAAEKLEDAAKTVAGAGLAVIQATADFIRPQPSTTPAIPRPAPTTPAGVILRKTEEEGKEAVNTLRNDTADAVEVFGKDIGEVLMENGENLAALPGNMVENFVTKFFDSLFGGGENGEEAEFLSLKDILNQTVAGATDAFKQLKDTLGNALKTMADTVKGILVNTANELLSLVLKPVTDALASVVKSVLDSILGADGLLGSLFGGLFGRAGGGRVQPGLPVLVGERGPELLVPNRAMTVMNNADSRMAMAGTGHGSGAMQVRLNAPPPQINIVNQSGGDVRTSRRKGPNMQDIIDIVIGRTADDLATGGETAGVLETRYGLRPVGV